MDIDTVADELYGLLPAEFTATRGAREKEAKAAGDKELATQIHALTKPNQVAWMVNLLVRQHPEEVRPLIELGAGLREASDDLDADSLREFSRQQHLLLRALVQQARRLATAAGRKVNETVVRSLEDTLRAALVDPDAAAAVLSGQLTGGLQHSGFGPAGVGGGSGTAPRAARRKPATSEPPVDEVAVARLAAADRELAAATDAAERSRDAQDEAAERAEQAAALVAAAAAEVQRLTAELERAVAERAARETDEEQRRTALDAADRTLVEAEERLATATARRRQLDE